LTEKITEKASFFCFHYSISNIDYIRMLKKFLTENKASSEGKDQNIVLATPLCYSVFFVTFSPFDDKGK